MEKTTLRHPGDKAENIPGKPPKDPERKGEEPI
jgi:hypothetical protein